ncbi:hypothetical protein K9F17_20660, partial [Stenotrophomonas acidaminiphila]|nr:hypothetical protein [Stenotrophomonas acidaminiphila]
TRDSRFRAGIGMVMVPKAGDMGPIRVAWEKPLKARFIATLDHGVEMTEKATPPPLDLAEQCRDLVTGLREGSVPAIEHEQALERIRHNLTEIALT